MSRDSVPEWFRRCTASPPEQATVDVDGCEVNYLTWGEPADPGLLLVHGGAAHAHWWSFLAPMLARGYHVAALDLSGHGDSGRRDAYVPEQWAEEVMAVGGATGMDRPVLVGHSMGGFVSIVAASRFGDELAGTVIVDSALRRPDPEREEARRGRMFAAPKTYPTLEEGMEHFVLVPPQPCENDFVLGHVARHSLHRTAAGWTWKFDPRIFHRFSSADPVFADYLSATRCRVAVFHGELSGLATGEVTAYMNELLGRNAPFVELPQAGHHVFLDQPLAFVAALRAILADWEHTVPRRGPGTSAGG